MRDELVKCRTLKSPDDRRHDFTERLRKFVIENPERELDITKVFDGDLTSWRKTLVNRLAYLQQISRIPGVDISVSTDHTKFKILAE